VGRQREARLFCELEQIDVRAKLQRMTEVIDAPAAVKPINHWIAGRPYPGSPGRRGPAYNPARGVQTGGVDLASLEEVDAAVQAAKAAFPGWRALSLSRRAELFFRIHR